MILNILLAIIPCIIISVIIYYSDKIEKESKKLLFLLFLLGILSALITGILSVKLANKIPFLNYNYDELNKFQFTFKFLIAIALLEEFLKWIFNIIFTWNNKEFNYIYDSIVYSTFIAIGFACTENIIYIIHTSPSLSIILLRDMLIIPSHILFGTFSGTYIGIAKNSISYNKKNKANKYIIFSLIFPIILHFMYDILIARNLYILFIIFIFIAYISIFFKIKSFSKIKKKLIV